MISKGFKKQLITNAYNTQLLTDTNSADMTSIDDSKNTKNLLLFRKEDESLWVGYKCKNDNIDYDINWFLYYLIMPIYSIYQDSGRNKKYTIQKDISDNIKEILAKKHEIDNRLEYSEYMEDVHDQ